MSEMSQQNGAAMLFLPQRKTEKTSGLDMADAKKYIERTRHAIPTLRELETRLNGDRRTNHVVHDALHKN